jgi:hypothetical protein
MPAKNIDLALKARQGLRAPVYARPQRFLDLADFFALGLAIDKGWVLLNLRGCWLNLPIRISSAIASASQYAADGV